MIILASRSPRRIDMLKERGYDFKIIPSHVEENEPAISGMKELPMFLSLKKAMDVESETEKDDVIIAADTIVYTDRPVGKPADENEARGMLLSYSGNSHYVITGVTMIKSHTDIKTTFASVSKVYFRDFTYEDIEEYLKTEEPYDKAGAYAIQGWCGRLIEKYEGSLDNIIGFPMDEIVSKLQAML